MSDASTKQRGWYSELQALIDRHGKIASNKSKEVSHRTKEMRAQVLFMAFRELGELGAQPQHPENLKPKHVRLLMEKWEAANLSPSTLQNRFSIFTVFCKWIGKPGMLGDIAQYLSAPEAATRTYAASTDKSWSTNGVDPHAIIEAVQKEDLYVAMQLKVLFAFGMRVKEAVMFKPHRADHGTHVALTHKAGTKGGRPRSFPIDTELKRAVLEEAKALAGGLDGHIANPKRTLTQNLHRFYNVVRKFGITRGEAGVTAHGLRVEYLNERFEQISGLPSPVRGGFFTEEQKALVRQAQTVCAEESGHSRFTVTTAYYGPLKFTKVPAKGNEQASPADALKGASTDAPPS